MKIAPLLTALALASTVTSVVFAQTPAPVTATAPVGERMPPERLELKVLKVYAAKDGDAIFRAYVVLWKEQEVIVSDSLAKTNYKEGDTITVLAMNHPFPQGKEPHRLLAFTAIPPRP